MQVYGISIKDVDLVMYVNEFPPDNLKKLPTIAGVETVDDIESLKKLSQV